MSAQSNFEMFLKAAKDDPSLQADIRRADEDWARSLATLSGKVGLPCKPEEFLRARKELSEADLDTVGGGFSLPPEINSLSMFQGAGSGPS